MEIEEKRKKHEALWLALQGHQCALEKCVTGIGLLLHLMCYKQEEEQGYCASMERGIGSGEWEF